MKTYHRHQLISRSLARKSDRVRVTGRPISATLCDAPARPSFGPSVRPSGQCRFSHEIKISRSLKAG
jgi:hypothetical protein